MHSQKPMQTPKRKRGVILSVQGWQRLQSAEYLSYMRDNSGKPYTLDQLAEMTGLSPNTLTKVRRRQKSVDTPTVEDYFQAFGLVLEPEDCLGQEVECCPTSLASLQLGPLKGQLTIDSPFYIYRPPIERLCSDEVMKPGALVRIKGPYQYGKTSLMAQVLNRVQNQGLRTVVVSLRGADQQVFQSTDRFLRWFCAMVARGLGLPAAMDSRWDGMFGGNYSCSEYFETYLLPAAEAPLLLAIDDLDEIFRYPAVAMDFLGLLRTWYERGHYGVHSQQFAHLRLMVVHATLILSPFNLGQSPFDVGLMVDLDAFTLTQVQELVQRYGLVPPVTVAQQLYDLLGGHPYLTQLALYHLSQKHISLAELPLCAIAHKGIFSSHLRQQLSYLQRDPTLLEAIAQVVEQDCGVTLDPHIAFKLEEVGLITFEGQRALPGCNLYRQYFAALCGDR